MEAFVWTISLGLMIDFHGDVFVSEAYWLRFTITLMTLMFGRSIAIWLTMLFQDGQKASEMFGIPLFIFILDLGFFIPKMNAFWEALQYVNPLYYGFKALCIAEWEDRPVGFINHSYVNTTTGLVENQLFFR